MNTEARFLIAIVLMLGVLVGTNLIFPPVPPEEGLVADSLSTAPAAGAEDAATSPLPPSPEVSVPSGDVDLPFGAASGQPVNNTVVSVEPTSSEVRVVVESPLYRHEFSNYGARLVAAELKDFQSLAGAGGPLDLVTAGSMGLLGQRIVVGTDTLDLAGAAFEVEPAGGVTVQEGGGSETLSFVYEHPSGAFRFEQTYTFHPDSYIIDVEGTATGSALERPLLLTSLGDGLPYVEADSATEDRMMAYVSNHLEDGIRSVIQAKAEPVVVEGPLRWAAVRNKFFVIAMLADRDEEMIDPVNLFGGLVVGQSALPGRVQVRAAQSLASGGAFDYTLYMGPQEYARLDALGQDMKEVNPYGWRIFRPIVRPFVAVIMWILAFLHTNLSLGYGWVLIVFGVMMRVVLFPLNQKAMRAQLRNMAVQPLVQEVQAKYKDNPEKLQKEMMRLYKEHGFNPLAGCLPMLLPWPVLIALFFVFQNTIELRGVEFLWMPDLSAPDPLYLLPVFLGLSMFLMQYVSMKSLDKPNPQMKMMMYIMPVMMVFIFFRLASGLNLYYATANIATIPQQIYIARERMKMKGKPPPTFKSK